MGNKSKSAIPFNGMVISEEIPFNGKVAMKDGKILALVFQDSLTKKQHEYLRDWWMQYYLDIVRKYER